MIGWCFRLGSEPFVFLMIAFSTKIYWCIFQGIWYCFWIPHSPLRYRILRVFVSVSRLLQSLFAFQVDISYFAKNPMSSLESRLILLLPPFIHHFTGKSKLPHQHKFISFHQNLQILLYYLWILQSLFFIFHSLKVHLDFPRHLFIIFYFELIEGA